MKLCIRVSIRFELLVFSRWKFCHFSIDLTRYFNKKFKGKYNQLFGSFGSFENGSALCILMLRLIWGLRDMHPQGFYSCSTICEERWHHWTENSTRDVNGQRSNLLELDCRCHVGKIVSSLNCHRRSCFSCKSSMETLNENKTLDIYCWWLKSLWEFWDLFNIFCGLTGFENYKFSNWLWMFKVWKL